MNMEHLAFSAEVEERDKAKKKKKRVTTDLHMTPNECKYYSIATWCVNKAVFAKAGKPLQTMFTHNT